MRVQYEPKDWRPESALEEEILTLFTLLHVLEPVDKVTLRIVEGDHLCVLFPDGRIKTAWAAYLPPTNTITLPAQWRRGIFVPQNEFYSFVLWDLAHEYVHAIRNKDGRDTGHRGFDQEIMGLLHRVPKET